MPDRSILTVNAGSSSLKFAIYSETGGPQRHWSGAIDRIGLTEAHLRLFDASGVPVFDAAKSIPDHASALDHLMEVIAQHSKSTEIVAVGHRVVHGGPDCDCSRLVDPALEAYLRRFVAYAPLHQPANLAGIKAMRTVRPDLIQIACFDTAFHHGLPLVARLSGLPRAMQDDGLRRYGFHGLSYEYILGALQRDGVDTENEKIIIAHLGNGASMCAIEAGVSIETTMGFSTIAGLPMGTRAGDIDPGLLLYLLTHKGLSPTDLTELLYKQSGLLGLSGISRNMQDLLAHQHGPAAEAIDYFCYHARQHLAGLTASLGGLDRLVFTGGIGANVSRIRDGICDRLDYLGVRIDTAENATDAAIISPPGSRVTIEVRKTDEELVIANHVRRMLAAPPIAIKA